MWVHADFTRLTQAFANILDNAVKYTDRGGRISVSAATDSEDAVVTFTDTGVGIDPAVLPGIFGMFVQAEQSPGRVRSGLGIGLALAKRLIELHEGSIEARSDGTGTGASFIVRLPLLAEAPVHVSSAAPTRAAGRCRVLVAEDIPDAAEMMRLMLGYMGHDVRVAADGVQALDIARQFDPDVVLLDIGMPRMDGYEAARQIRAALGPRVVLVALTGWGQEQDQRRAYAAGFDHHVTKPAEPDVLEALIDSARRG